MVYVSWTKVLIIYEIVTHPFVMMFLDGFRYVHASDPWKIATILSQISALSVINYLVNGPIASGSLPYTVDPLRIDP